MSTTSAYGLPHHLYDLPRQRTICHIICMICHVIVRMDCTNLYSQHPFFPCLPFWIEHDISHSLHPFEPKQVVLGSQRRGLCSHVIWSDSEHFEFLRKIWSHYHTSPLESFWTSKRLYSVMQLCKIFWGKIIYRRNLNMLSMIINQRRLIQFQILNINNCIHLHIRRKI